MAAENQGSRPIIRDLVSFDDLRKVEAIEREAWGMSDIDVTPLTVRIASCAAGNLWIGAFDGPALIGFAFAFFGMEHGQVSLHSHMLAVKESYRGSNVGYQLKLAQRERALALQVRRMTWTFDPLQSRNAHLNFAKLGVVSDSYHQDFYGPETSSILHRNGTDRLWVTWPMSSRRVQCRLQGKDDRSELLDKLSTLVPLVHFNGDGHPVLSDLSEALGKHRVAIEIPSDIDAMEQKNSDLAYQWRLVTRHAFTEALKAGFFVAEFCRTVRGQQGPGVYLLEKGTLAESVPELIPN